MNQSWKEAPTPLIAFYLLTIAVMLCAISNIMHNKEFEEHVERCQRQCISEMK